MSDLAARLRDRIHREGPIPFDAYVAAALYDQDSGFFARGGGAGRAGRDFLTSPETGECFGACIARALDTWWRVLGEPDPYLVVEIGAGRGVLARSVLRANPQCTTALRYVLVERSAHLREAQRQLLSLEDPELVLGPGMRDDLDEDHSVMSVPRSGPLVTAVDTIPALHARGVVLANELLDNLPFRIATTRDGVWNEIRVGFDARAGFIEMPTPLDWSSVDAAFHALPDPQSVPDGARLPVLTALRPLWSELHACLRSGIVACIDYAESTKTLLDRGDAWLRTFRAHCQGTGPLETPGAQDITIDVPLEAWNSAVEAHGWRSAGAPRQAEWLRALGIETLADAAAEYWRANASVGDLAAIAARSRVHEAAALTDPTGLGAYRVLLAHTPDVSFSGIGA
ncbi:MAG: SAM-dependent methyltransferase [Acidimicrobiia bacterium]